MHLEFPARPKREKQSLCPSAVASSLMFVVECKLKICFEHISDEYSFVQVMSLEWNTFKSATYIYGTAKPEKTRETPVLSFFISNIFWLRLSKGMRTYVYTYIYIYMYIFGILLVSWGVWIRHTLGAVEREGIGIGTQFAMDAV